jgi:hypothetical protein
MKTWRSYHAISTRRTITTAPRGSRDSGIDDAKAYFGPTFGISCPHFDLLFGRAAASGNQASPQHVSGLCAALAESL